MKNKQLRMPNGYGGVVLLTNSDRRRRPWAARVTVGREGNKYIQKAIGYYATREEALIALADYNKNPLDLSARDITMAELFDAWRKHPHGLSAGTVKNLEVAYCACGWLHNTAYRNIRIYQMQRCIDESAANATKRQIKVLFGHLDKYGYGRDIINKKYSESLRVESVARLKDRVIFTTAEIRALWNNTSAPWADSVLILLYSGWRVQELLNLKRTDVNIEAGIMTGGVKTKAGKNRIVPIHSAILPLIKKRLEGLNEGEYLFNANGQTLTRRSYRYYYDKVMSLIGTKHCIHETRHTFRTELDRVGANKVCADKIMGHKNADIGLGTYVQKNIDELKQAVELITYSLTEEVL